MFRLWSLLIWLLALPFLLFPEQMPAVAAFFALLLLLNRLGAKRVYGRFFPATVLDVWIASYLACAGIAQLFSPLPLLGLPKLSVMIAGVFGYYLWQEWFPPPVGNSPHLPLFFTLASGLLSFIGLFVLEWNPHQIVNLDFLTQRLPHLSGDFYLNYNEMAGTLVLLLPFACYACWNSWQNKKGWFLLAFCCLGLTILVLLLTQSRGGLLSLLFATVVWLGWGRIPLYYVVPVASAGIFFSILFLQLSETGQSWLATVDAMTKVGSTNSWLARLEIYNNAWQMSLDYPILGAGLYSFDPISRLNYPYQLISPTFNLTHAHNLWLQTSATIGLPALVALSGLWLTLGKQLWQTKSGRLIGTSLVAYLSFNLFDLLDLGQKPGLLVWLIMAAAVVTLTNEPMPPKPRFALSLLPLFTFALLLPTLPINLANLQLDRWRVLHRPPLPTLTATAFEGDARRMGLMAYLQGDEQAAQRSWQNDPQAGLFLRSQGLIALNAGMLSDSLNWYNNAILLDPDKPLAYFWRGIIYKRLNNFTEAAQNFAQAAAHRAGTTIAWQGTILNTWSQSLAQQGDLVQAQQAIQEAIALEPNRAAHYYQLQDILQAMGDEAGAKEAVRRAQELEKP